MKEGASIIIGKMVERKKNNKKTQSSKIVERGKRGGWIAITNNKKAQSFERIKKGKGGWIAITSSKKVQNFELRKS
jgi:hypothetical protein